MKISVLIPTFRRPNDLHLVLETLKTQERPPHQVVVTVRDTDLETQNFFDAYVSAPLPLQMVTVTEPGVVAAMNVGLNMVTGDIVALTDDDTEPFPDWLRRIETHFEQDPALGGVGGRDFQKIHPGPETTSVGRVEWWGRIIGNHHVGVGPAQEVDILKGANCAYRTVPLRAIGFDTRLLGQGAQVNWELGIGLALRQAGWKIVFDPAIAVHHHVKERFGDDQFHRGVFKTKPHHEAVHNETMFLWENFVPIRRYIFLLWAFLIGTRSEPGLIQLVRFVGKKDIWARFPSMISGRIAGIKTARTVPRPGSLPLKPDTQHLPIAVQGERN